MENELTILLLLKDRTAFTWRWFNFYNQIGLPFKVLVADGGKDKSVEKLSDRSLFPNLDYEYVRYPYDKDSTAFFKKTYDALSTIHTKYVLFASNDDFYFKDGLNQAIKFLDKNSGYAASRGNIYTFKVNPTHKSTGADVYGKMSFLGIKTYNDISNTDNAALKRVLAFSENYSDSLWHYVCNTEKLVQCYKTLLESNITDLVIADSLTNYLIVAAGKINCEDSPLYMLHQDCIDGLGHTVKDPSKRMMADSWPGELLKMFNLTAEKVASSDKISIDYANHKIMQYYIYFILGQKTITSYLERKSAIKPSEIFTLSFIFKKNGKIGMSLKTLYEYVKNRVQERMSNKIIKSSPYRKDIEIIKEFLLKDEK